MAPLPQVPPAFDFSDIAFFFVVLILVGAFCWRVRSAMRSTLQSAVELAVELAVKELKESLKDKDKDTDKGE